MSVYRGVPIQWQVGLTVWHRNHVVQLRGLDAFQSVITHILISTTHNSLHNIVAQCQVSSELVE